MALGYEKQTLHLGVDTPQKLQRLPGETNYPAPCCTRTLGVSHADVRRPWSRRQVLDTLPGCSKESPSNAWVDRSLGTVCVTQKQDRAWLGMGGGPE